MSKKISSSDNAVYKELKELSSSARARKLAGRTLLDGINLCQAYIDHRGAPAMCVVSESACENIDVMSLMQYCVERDVTCIVLSDGLYKTLSVVDAHVGVIFVVMTPALDASTVLIDNAVLLDQVQDPGNVGSILRSAAAAGIVDIFCNVGTASMWSPKILRAAVGAHFLLRIHESIDLNVLLKNSKVPVLATSSHVDKTIYDIDLTKKVAWLFGHEGQGVSEALMQLTAHQVGIPHVGEMESLNVAACAAICFFEQVRQRRDFCSK